MIFNKFIKDKKKKITSDNKTPITYKWPEHIVTLDNKNFKEFIQKYPLSIVDFWASWCAPCKTMAPRLRRLSKIYKGKVAFGKLDTQKNKDISKQYKIIGIPQFIFFNYGKKITSLVGVKTVGDMKDFIDDLLMNIKR